MRTLGHVLIIIALLATHLLCFMIGVYVALDVTREDVKRAVQEVVNEAVDTALSKRLKEQSPYHR